MARRSKIDEDNDSDLDEVDAFNANREKILLDQAGEYGRQRDYDDDDSEEEVMNIEDDSDDEVEQQGQSDDGEEEEEEEEEDEEEYEEKGWGGRKNYYGGDEISDDEDEDAKQMTEEALRQQKKHLQELQMDDYLDDDMQLDWQKKADVYDNKESENNKSTIEILKTDNSFENLNDDDKLKILKQSFPEFIPLLKEFTELKSKSQDFSKIDKNEIISIKIVALNAYLAALASYFAIFIDNLSNNNQDDAFISMKDNPIMETILSSREIWRQANELPEDAELPEKQEEDVHEEVYEFASSDIDEDAFVDAKEEQSGSEDIDDDDDDDDDKEEESEEDDNLDIDVNTERKIKRISMRHGDDFTEGDIEDIDMEDKQRRKKTLRFYTSKIDKAAAKKEQLFTGDMDVPYKERLFERQQRLIEEARQRGLDKRDIDLPDEELNSANVDDDDDDGYYQSVKQNKIQKKQSRKSAHEAAVKAAKEGKLAELQEGLGEDGKRAINYQILKNKGLTPHRKKEYRNSRVKKRKQYEKAQKKLKSVRQVYDSSKSSAPYGGETTGIKKGLSRSVKLV